MRVESSGLGPSQRLHKTRVTSHCSGSWGLCAGSLATALGTRAWGRGTGLCPSGQASPAPTPTNGRMRFKSPSRAHRTLCHIALRTTLAWAPPQTQYRPVTPNAALPKGRH